jgi:hypothetical protein
MGVVLICLGGLACLSWCLVCIACPSWCLACLALVPFLRLGLELLAFGVLLALGVLLAILVGPKVRVRVRVGFS